MDGVVKRVGSKTHQLDPEDSARAADVFAKISLVPPGTRISSAAYVDFERKSAVLGGPEGGSSWVSGTFHLVTVMIGAGVLALPSAFALLGWLLGPLLLILFGGERFNIIRYGR